MYMFYLENISARNLYLKYFGNKYTYQLHE